MMPHDVTQAGAFSCNSVGFLPFRTGRNGGATPRGPDHNEHGAFDMATPTSIHPFLARKATIERRAEMAAECQCLAAWDDDRECICDKTVELPLSIEALKDAHRIANDLAKLERQFVALAKIPDDHLRCQGGRDAEIIGWSGGEDLHVVHYSDGRRSRERENISFRLPKKVVKAALEAEKLDLLAQLQNTGIISISSPNIKAVPK